jgi:hypothetical protein
MAQEADAQYCPPLPRGLDLKLARLVLLLAPGDAWLLRG